MTTSEILKKVRELEIKSKRLTNHLFTGEYHTAFKGRGMLFKEVKEYSAGDDVRFIDWNVSARMNHTYTKVFEEERELSVYLLVDFSGSNNFGTFHQTKKDLIIELCAVLAFSAINNNDKAGCLLFSDKVEKYIKAAKGRNHVLYMVREMLALEPASSHTNIVSALQYLNNIAKHKSIVFVLSDFADAGYREALKVAAKKHDVIGVQVLDKADTSINAKALIQLEDAETGKLVTIDMNELSGKQSYAKQNEIIINEAKETFRTAGADLMQVFTGEDYVKALQQFFFKRA